MRLPQACARASLVDAIPRGVAIAIAVAAMVPTESVAGEETAEAAAASIWAGVYTEAQSARGAIAYSEPCGKCHGRKLDGAPDDPDMFSTPPVAGPKFLRDWDGRSVLALFEYTKATMPANNPGYFSDSELVDVIAYMLEVSGVPAGTRELAPDRDALGAVVLTAAP